MQEYVIEPLKRIIRDRKFVLCSLVLAFSAGSMQVVAKTLGLHFVKLSVPLQNSLDDLDDSRLSPFLVKSKNKIENEDVVAELGTEEYIQWILEDPGAGENEPGHYISLFITYYTGDPDVVPHVPEVCYTGAGNTITKRSGAVIEYTNGEGLVEEIPVRVLTISSPKSYDSLDSKVVYFFSVNGHLEGDRSMVRFRLNNWFDRYAYFSKVEMVFREGGKMTEDDVVSVVERLSQNLVPLLRDEHWPVWPPKFEQ